MKPLKHFLPFLLFPLAVSAQSFNTRWHTTVPMTAPRATSTTLPPAAILYVSTPLGVVAYSASRAGVIRQLTGPVRVAGNLVGGSPTRLLTLDGGNLYAYALGSTGALAGLTARVSIASYAGAECGTATNAILRSGFVYVQLAGAVNATGNNVCDAIQSYKLDGNGLTFEGATVYDQGRFAAAATSPVLGSGFAYDLTMIEDACEDQFNVFSRETSGALDVMTAPVTAPLPNPMGGSFFPFHLAADPTNHLAVAMTQDFAPPCGPSGNIQLASFTINPDGSLISTNTYQNMPITVADVEVMRIDPSGTLLAIAGFGVTLYHFNGPAPITAMTRNLLPGAGVSAAGFDNLHHLYAWGIDTDSRFKLFTFTITNTSVTRSAPVTVSSSSTGMIVVPR